MNKTQLTKDGFEKLQSELKNLIDVKRPYAVERLHKARSMGDLSENSEYHAAKEELAFVEGRIREVEEIIKHAVIVENHNNSNVIEVGSTVTVEENNLQNIFTIVGEFEADPANKKLSHTSPIGKTLLGKKVGELVEVDIPAGKKVFKILNIK
jgi:transcription elongation factor GreA